jgi:hypothetical protein
MIMVGPGVSPGVGDGLEGGGKTTIGGSVGSTSALSGGGVPASQLMGADSGLSPWPMWRRSLSAARARLLATMTTDKMPAIPAATVTPGRRWK